MGRDIAQNFRKIITIVPDDLLEDMRQEFQNNGTGSRAMEAAILTLSVELLRRKWGVHKKCVSKSFWDRVATFL